MHSSKVKGQKAKGKRHVKGLRAKAKGRNKVLRLGIFNVIRST
jgi:hypothetical protein